MSTTLPTAWRPYTPSADSPWTLAKAGHLLRRAGFGPTWAELQQAVTDGPQLTVDKLLAGNPADPDFDATSEYLASEKSLPAAASGTQLAAWWLARTLRTPHPLREKITLFWHNHFATSLAKVQNARQMLGQYRLLHRHALGDFRALLYAISTDPAMMVWLDTVGSVAGKPNENYARELMELFALGIGHYTEADVRQAARAFTGYALVNGVAKLDPKKHDAGEKTVLGKTGKLAADDVVKLCLEHPACPRFLVTKLYRFLVSDGDTPPAELVQPLADLYRDSGFDTAKLVGTILRSNHFHSEAAYRQKVKSPVEFAVGIVRGLEASPGPLRLAEALEPLGQALFAPPSVKGWDGGPAWLNAQTLLFRQNLALALTAGDDPRFVTRCDPAALLARHGAADAEQAVPFLIDLFLQGDVPPAAREKLAAHAAAPAGPTPRYWSKGEVASHKLRSLAHLTLTLPEFQLA